MDLEPTNDFYCDFVFSAKVGIVRVFETENVLAYHHTRPFWETHIVVVPKRHVASLQTILPDETDLLIEIISVVNKVAAELLAKTGAARVITNLGRYQESKHLHFHVCSGEQVRPDNTP
ncbi:MAG: HIT domain-containing protein [Acidobacteria bacterium]|nr:HIT domain-containing protein [Acidobacteriota bacterium]